MPLTWTWTVLGWGNGNHCLQAWMREALMSTQAWMREALMIMQVQTENTCFRKEWAVRSWCHGHSHDSWALPLRRQDRCGLICGRAKNAFCVHDMSLWIWSRMNLMCACCVLWVLWASGIMWMKCVSMNEVTFQGIPAWSSFRLQSICRHVVIWLHTVCFDHIRISLAPLLLSVSRVHMCTRLDPTPHLSNP